MDIKKLGLGLGAFVAGAVAWTWGARRYGDRFADALGAGASGGTRTGEAAAPRPSTRADASAGTAATEHPPRDTPHASAEHVPTDLLGDEPVTRDHRAPAAFRPDPTAVPTAEEREALRPATGPAPTLVADRGTSVTEPAGAA